MLQIVKKFARGGRKPTSKLAPWENQMFAAEECREGGSKSGGNLSAGSGASNSEGRMGGLVDRASSGRDLTFGSGYTEPTEPVGRGIPLSQPKTAARGSERQKRGSICGEYRFY